MNVMYVLHLQSPPLLRSSLCSPGHCHLLTQLEKMSPTFLKLLRTLFPGDSSQSADVNTHKCGRLYHGSDANTKWPKSAQFLGSSDSAHITQIYQVSATGL